MADSMASSYVFVNGVTVDETSTDGVSGEESESQTQNMPRLANNSETSANLSHNNDSHDCHMIKMKIKDVNRGKDCYTLYLEETFDDDQFIEDTIILDGRQRFVFVEFRSEQG